MDESKLGPFKLGIFQRWDLTKIVIIILLLPKLLIMKITFLWLKRNIMHLKKSLYGLRHKNQVEGRTNIGTLMPRILDHCCVAGVPIIAQSN